ncbi:hypothetical protein VOLCADRAFT_81158 [Volvox carteri f. nagariensis]|uniref:7,8-dihydroneopterin aldolase n=1 Tax=Volvox carteri f. nagariensis TaxID=3068 RepID=D8TW01_VOLCA|nr:uncharacterized protein VOLCADRAFT_81158 [Volvox carteri f. nagariensis]EFJ48393.1 hypothetical protein VOLCADRAFT_81158 [Volvox carteri f. nagariensis]|eukprot:XP_002950647.1 hypothetical protein VOLCADRAFT_81158 [Volvox carteri f. nagariensis]
MIPRISRLRVIPSLQMSILQDAAACRCWRPSFTCSSFCTSFPGGNYSHHSIPVQIGDSDWIHITGMRFHGHHGVLPEETRLGQSFVVDLKLQVNTSRAGFSDDLEDTVNYAAVYGDVKSVVEGAPCKLLEAVAHRAVSAVLQRHPRVRQVDFTIRKLAIPGVPSVVESVGVQIRRQR